MMLVHGAILETWTTSSISYTRFHLKNFPRITTIPTYYCSLESDYKYMTPCPKGSSILPIPVAVHPPNVRNPDTPSATRKNIPVF